MDRLSVTSTAKEYEPTVVGVPVMAPVEFRLNPGGSAEEPKGDCVKEKTNGGAPPLALICCEYGTPTVPLLNMGVRNVIGVVTVTENVRVALDCWASVTFMVKLNVLATETVPPTTPVEGLRDKPGGRAPAETLQV